ncbi:hypothetical protein GW17_00050792 [Ensete ventricosum]|nr:hypothetical protein GW17_00050792 [Ensete ventricosum]
MGRPLVGTTSRVGYLRPRALAEATPAGRSVPARWGGYLRVRWPREAIPSAHGQGQLLVVTACWKEVEGN